MAMTFCLELDLCLGLGLGLDLELDLCLNLGLNLGLNLALGLHPDLHPDRSSHPSDSCQEKQPDIKEANVHSMSLQMCSRALCSGVVL